MSFFKEGFTQVVFYVALTSSLLNVIIVFRHSVRVRNSRKDLVNTSTNSKNSLFQAILLTQILPSLNGKLSWNACITAKNNSKTPLTRKLKGPQKVFVLTGCPN